MNKNKYEIVPRRCFHLGIIIKIQLSKPRKEKDKGLWRVEEHETPWCCIEANALPRYEFVVRKTRVDF